MARAPPPPAIMERALIRHDIALDFNVEWARPLDQRGQVFLCHDRRDGATHVVKLLKQSTPSMAQRGHREHTMHDYLTRHAPDAVVPLLTVYENILFYPGNVQEKAFLLVMQHCREGDLFAYLKTHGWCLPEAEAKGMFHAIAKCVEKLHRLNVCHRDIKPENILFQATFSFDPAEPSVLVPVLADFGHTKFDRPESPLKTSDVGTERHNAAEIRSGQYTRAVDVYSLGTVLYFMLAGRPPYSDRERPPLSFAEPAWNHVSARARDLIVRMMNDQPSLRPTISEVLDDEWFRLPTGNLPSVALPPLDEIAVMSSFDQIQHQERHLHGADPNEEFDLLELLENPPQRRRMDSVESSRGI